MKNSVAVSGCSKTCSLIGCREIAKAFGIWIDFIGLQVEQKLARSVAGYKDTKGTHGIWETLGSVVSGRVFDLARNSGELARSSAAGRLQSLSGYG